MRRIFWIFLIGLVAFLIAVAVYDPLKQAVVAGLTQFGGGTYVALSGWWGGVAASPIYQQWHMLIWFAGGIVVAFAVHQLYTKNKIPLVHRTVQTAPVYQNAPTYATPQPIPSQPVPATEKKEEAK